MDIHRFVVCYVNYTGADLGFRVKGCEVVCRLPMKSSTIIFNGSIITYFSTCRQI